jgi:glucose/arabinose dehydrogenase/cytochrome c2
MGRFRLTQGSWCVLAAAALLPIGAGFRPPAAAAAAEEAGTRVWAEELASGLDQPWSMAWLPDGTLLITEKFGGLRQFRNGKLLPGSVPGLPAAYKAGQSGLLDIALDPDFATNRRLFIAYTEGTVAANRGAIFRARLTPNGLVDGTTIFRVWPDATKFPFPVAGRLQFLPDKTLLFTSSDDEYRRAMVQKLDNDIGKILRIDRDGRAPADNPFVGTPGARPEIYAIGVRGPLGLLRDPRDGSLWETENGPRGGDELNRLRKGANYGWPITTYGTEYSGAPITDRREAPGIESPLAYWVPSISPSGLAINLGNRYPGWKGDFFSGALSGRQLRRIRIANGKVTDQEVLLANLNERIRDVRYGPDGYLYLLTDNPNGRLLRLRPGTPRGNELGRVAQPVSTDTARSIFIALATPPATKPGDPDHGREVFEQRCMSCHAVAAGAPPGIGPNLAGVFGRQAGSGGGNVSEALRRSGIIWTQTSLYSFIGAPAAKVPGTTMPAAAPGDPQGRTDLIAYLRTLNGR